MKKIFKFHEGKFLLSLPDSMPKAKKKDSLAADAKAREKKKSPGRPAKKKAASAGRSPVRRAPKKTEKKAKAVVIDIIEDEEEESRDFPELPETPAYDFRGADFQERVRQQEEALEALAAERELEEPENSGLDQQKNFFSRYALESATAPKEERQGVKRVGLYRRLVWKFAILIAAVFLIVAYFSLFRLNIKIVPRGEALNDSLLLKITAEAASTTAETENDFREPIEGNVEEITVASEKSFTASGEEPVGNEIAGQVRIINNSAKAQALVATTRLLSPDNKLYRIKEAVNVPAGGEVSVAIYSDSPSAELAIAPTTFTIPGLWVGLQDKIYAKSDASFNFRQQVKHYIKANDIEAAKEELRNDLANRAQAALAASTGEERIVQELEPPYFEIDAKAGEAKENFTVKASATYVAIAFPRKEVARLAAAKLALVVPEDKELTNDGSSSLSYVFDNYDRQAKVATVKATFSGTMVLQDDTEIIDKKQLVNLTRSQIDKYLETFPEIKSYELDFFPSFMKRAPQLPERIDIKVEGLER